MLELSQSAEITNVVFTFICTLWSKTHLVLQPTINCRTWQLSGFSDFFIEEVNFEIIPNPMKKKDGNKMILPQVLIK